jgi:hypothetical protein
MASIARTDLFCWNDIDELGDLERLQLVLGHQSIESLRRELRRNAQLRELCGFDIYRGPEAVPKPWVYTRFVRSLLKHEEEVVGIFVELSKRCYEQLPGFGRELGCDGKALASVARHAGRCERGDRRGDHEAKWGVHTHRSTGSEGTVRETVKRWFGYKLHLIADTTYELPVAFTVLPAHANEMPVMHKLLSSLKSRRAGILETCQVFTGDRGYDDGKLLTRLWDEFRIKPVIDIRNTWKDSDPTHCVPGLENVTYDWSGTIRCMCPAMHTEREMAFGGFEQDRMTLKYRCPARHYGYECHGMHRCAVRSSVRVRLSTNRRIFTPIARSSYRWKTLYRRRTALERINSRIDTSFGFENHTIRGLAKMSTMVTISLSVMLALALGRATEKRLDLMRSLVRSAA